MCSLWQVPTHGTAQDSCYLALALREVLEDFLMEVLVKCQNCGQQRASGIWLIEYKNILKKAEAKALCADCGFHKVAAKLSIFLRKDSHGREEIVHYHPVRKVSLVKSLTTAWTPNMITDQWHTYESREPRE